MPVSQQEQDLLSSINVERVAQATRHLTQFGQRLAGSAGERACAEWIAEEFRKAGLEEVRVEPFPTSTWEQRAARLEVLTSPRKELPVLVYGGCWGIWGAFDGKPYARGNKESGRTIEAELREVGTGTAGEFDLAGDLTGAVALVERADDVTIWPTMVLFEAALRGCLAVIFHGSPLTKGPSSALRQDIVGGPIPAFSLSRADGVRLRERLARGPVRIRLEGEVTIQSSAKGRSWNVSGTLRGSKWPDELVAVGGHLDAWHAGALDDAVSIATLAEMARILSEAKRSERWTPARSIRFVAVGAEELGGEADGWYRWLLGSLAYVQAHDEELAKLVLELNLDVIGAAGLLELEASPDVVRFTERLVDDLRLRGHVTIVTPPSTTTDAWCYMAVGGGSVLGEGGPPEYYQTIYHSQFDTIAALKREPLGDHLRVLLLALLRSSGSLELPGQLLELAQWALAEHSQLARQLEELPPELASSLEQTLSALHHLTLELPERSQDEDEGSRKRVLVARRALLRVVLGMGGAAGAWRPMYRPAQLIGDLAALQRARQALEPDEDRGLARAALDRVEGMGWGIRLSPPAHEAALAFMRPSLAWGGAALGSQSPWLQVRGLYERLADERMPRVILVAELHRLEAETVALIIAQLEAITKVANALAAGAPPAVRGIERPRARREAPPQAPKRPVRAARPKKRPPRAARAAPRGPPRSQRVRRRPPSRRARKR